MYCFLLNMKREYLKLLEKDSNNDLCSLSVLQYFNIPMQRLCQIDQDVCGDISSHT
jgi:hypothetical protein